jgi:hypothetical protein
MLKPCSSSNVENSPATPLDQVSKTRRVVVAVGDRQDLDLDRHGGVRRNSSSRKLPRSACEPTTMTSGRSMI